MSSASWLIDEHYGEIESEKIPASLYTHDIATLPGLITNVSCCLSLHANFLRYLISANQIIISPIAQIQKPRFSIG